MALSTRGVIVSCMLSMQEALGKTSPEIPSRRSSRAETNPSGTRLIRCCRDGASAGRC